MKIILNNVSFSYNKHSVLKNCDDEFISGKINYLLGYNGAGKSTLFDLISGIQKVDTGKITGNTQTKAILYQTQNPVFFGSLKGRDLQEFIFGVSDGHKEITIEELSPRFKSLYHDLMPRKLGDMSAGEKRWLLIFLESYLNKKIFLLDEPTSGVDPVSTQQINRQLLQMAQDPQKLLIVTTHDLHHIVDVNCYIHLLNNKKIKRFDSYAAFVKPSATLNPEEAFALWTNKDPI
ncbi:ATP-binding cassette domain-containing protein [Bombilactobacillus mellis]|uniref:ATP-binding cassette domain-containing protein n=1 Tax=Bombilactobacillus mellis TaxID=1218508 RepID=UPI00224731BF|nr:ATP-binding cassette domain-containing protein [Bombilactobacillus mellis]MCX0279895.1 ATP-binding cassette domain-containing protein [Bombilactobacillus mellis]